MANLIGRAAAHAGLPPPPAATTARSDCGLDGPFADDFTRYAGGVVVEPNRAVPTRSHALADVA